IYGSSCTGSDGSRIFVGSYNDPQSEESANRAFARELKNASKIASVVPIFDKDGTEIGKRALVYHKNSVKIVELLKIDETQHYKPFSVSIIEAPDFKRALAYEDQQREQSRVVRLADFAVE